MSIIVPALRAVDLSLLVAAGQILRGSFHKDSCSSSHTSPSNHPSEKKFARA